MRRIAGKSSQDFTRRGVKRQAAGQASQSLHHSQKARRVQHVVVVLRIGEFVVKSGFAYNAVTGRHSFEMSNIQPCIGNDSRSCPKGGSRRTPNGGLQPHGHFRHRWAGRRRGPDGPQDHCRHLWRGAPHGGGSLLRQGPDQGGPLGGLCGALSCQERRGRRPCRQMHDPAQLCHRRVETALDLLRYLRHGRRARQRHRTGHRQGHRSHAARHPQPSAAQQADLCAYSGLWSLRSRAGGGWRLQLGKDRPDRGA